MSATPTLDEAWCLDQVWHTAKPRPRVSVSQWADGNIILTSKQSGEYGPWRTSRNPLVREIQDCFSPDSKVREVVLMVAAQLFKTSAIVNILAANMKQSPAPMMVMNPTLEATVAWKAQRWNPIMQDTPAIRDLIGGLRMRDAANRQDMIDFPGGILFFSSGNSPNSYAGKSVKIMVMDDLDRFPQEIAGEGDPIFLARQRLSSFRRAKLLLASTPTETETSHIWHAWQSSDQRRAWVPCPHCGEYQPLEWGGKDIAYGLKWDKGLTEAGYVCRHCGSYIAERNKPEMLANHQWRPAHPEVSRRGYTASKLYSPIGLGPSWLELARQWHDAIQSTATHQAFVNTVLGEPWTARGEEITSAALLSRLETYDPDEMRELGYVLTAGIDVQKSRIEASLYWVGPDEECWYLTHIIEEGDTAGAEPWDALEDTLAELRPDCGGVDTGYNTDQAAAFCNRFRNFYPLKGIEGRGKTLIEDDAARKMRLRRKKKKGFSPHLVSNQAGMALITRCLKLTPPELDSDGKLCATPGYIHFPVANCFDAEFFDQLTSNKLEEKKVRGKTIYEWRERKPNEAYDCWKYGLAGFRLSKLKTSQRAKPVAEEKTSAPPVRVAQSRPEARALPRIKFGRAW